MSTVGAIDNSINSAWSPLFYSSIKPTYVRVVASYTALQMTTRNISLMLQKTRMHFVTVNREEAICATTNQHLVHSVTRNGTQRRTKVGP